MMYFLNKSIGRLFLKAEDNFYIPNITIILLNFADQRKPALALIVTSLKHLNLSFGIIYKLILDGFLILPVKVYIAIAAEQFPSCVMLLLFAKLIPNSPVPWKNTVFTFQPVRSSLIWQPSFSTRSFSTSNQYPAYLLSELQ